VEQIASWKQTNFRQERDSPSFMELDFSLSCQQQPLLFSLFWDGWILPMPSHAIFNIQFNIILPSMPRYSKWCLSFNFTHLNHVSIFLLTFDVTQIFYSQVRYKIT
jgi:hypothetical protein